MFKCTDCSKEYIEHPGYCDCGNDQFEEIFEAGYPEEYTDNAVYDDSQDYYDDYDDNAQGYDTSYDDGYADSYEDDYEEEYVPPVKLKKSKSKKSSKKKGITNSDKIGIGVFAVCIVLSILAFIFIGAGKTSNAGKDSSGKPLLVKDYSIPVKIDQIWDNTLPAGAPSAAKVDPSKILNTKLSSLDTEMNAYLISLAQAMINAWDRSSITGNGVTQLEFLIQTDGTLAGKKIYKFSGNKTLDASVGKIITSFGKFQVPPTSYKQEIIIVSFSSNNGSMKAYYPNVKVK